MVACGGGSSSGGIDGGGIDGGGIDGGGIDGGGDNGGGDNGSTLTTPTDYEIQPSYSGAIHKYTQDTDGDGIADINDPVPSDKAVASVAVFSESEFNNNIPEANEIHNTDFPIIAEGTLSKGNSYYLDSDFFRFSGKKDQRLSILVYKGSVNSDGTEFTLKEQFFTPKVTLLDENGRVITSLQINQSGELVSGIGVELPSDGDYYLEVSDLSIHAKDYSYSYFLVINIDTDFDGVSDDLEDVIGSNKSSRDSDADDILDFSEIFPSIIITDSQEKRAGTTNWWDADGDKIPNWWDVDSDGDGPPDRKEGILDLDSDGIQNFLDTDSNNNGTPDTNEVGESFQLPVDTDGDGLDDFMDLDADNDGIPSSIDNDDRTVQPPEYMFDEQASAILSVQAMIDGNTTLNDVCLVGKELLVHGLNIKPDTKVLFPIKGGTKVVVPTEIDPESRYLKITVPPEALSGTMYLYSTDSKLSNGYDANIQNSETNPVIFPLLDSLYAGQSLTLKGLNLSEGQVSVVFTNQSGSVYATGVASGDEIVLTVPAEASSNILYVEVGGETSNSIKVSIISTVTANVEIPAGANIECSDVQITQQDGVTKFANAQCSLSDIEVDNNNIDFISIFRKDSASDIHSFYEAVVLPTDTTTTLNSLSTAVKIVFYNLGYHISQKKQSWSNILNIIKNDQDVIALADYIEQDPTVLAQFTDATLVSKFQDALISSSNSVATYLSSQSASIFAQPNMKGSLVEPDITPAKVQNDILLHPTAPADIAVENETLVYLSVEVTDTSDNYIGYTDSKGSYHTYSHITNPWDSSIISPQWGGFLLISTQKEFKIKGRDSHFDIVTGGIAAPDYSSSAYRYTIGRTLFDGVAAPIMNKILEKIIGQKINSKDAAEVIIEVLGPKAWSGFVTDVTVQKAGFFTPLNTHIIIPMKTVMSSCFQLPVGKTCELLAVSLAKNIGLTPDRVKRLIIKTLGKEALTYLIPAAGQIKAVYEVLDKLNFVGTMLLTAKDIGITPKIVEFDVDYPLEIEEVMPMCLIKDKNEDLLLRGKGFLPYKTGYLYWKKEVTPVTSLGSEKGKFITASNDGTEMKVNFDEALEWLSTGEYTLKVEHQTQDAIFAQKIKVATDDIILDSISPNRGNAGSVVTLVGCGFSKIATENFVFFTAETTEGNPNHIVRATVLSSSADKLTVVVPEDAITGDVYVSADGIRSNTLLFTVESANVVITYGDCGSANDDTFSLYVDDRLVSSMSSPSRPFPVQVEMESGKHTVKMVGITAPDDVGTYCISFSNNVSVLSGPSLNGGDLTAGVVKSWQIEVTATATVSKQVRRSPFIEGKVLLPE